MTTVGLNQVISTQTPIKFAAASVGRKILMACTGLSLIGFLIVHLIGNLQLFVGQETLNNYAETLQSLGGLKWGFRLVLLALAAIHIWEGIVVWLKNRKARPVKYFREERVESTLFSRTMFWTGLLLGFFIVYHLLHFTLIVTNPEYATLTDGNRLDVYSMVITGFSHYAIAGTYIIAMALLAFHLAHAAESLFQTLGLNNTKYMPILKLLSNLFAFAIFVGYASMPVAVLFKLIQLPVGGN